MTETYAIQLNGLTKTFGGLIGKKVHAVKSATVNIQPHQVYGFLGPNGAGKTTTIRMLLDLMRPTSGTCMIYGQSPQRDHSVLRRVGALVEGPAFYPYLTGRKNLLLLARTHGGVDLKRVDTLLAQVGLSERANQRYNKYSLGMKQRLGLAAALLHDPDLLILDEPTNGLDPAGIQEMRVFIRDLVETRGKTVFLSSHMLSEVEQVCDRVAIINQGEIVHEGAVADVVADAASGGAQSVRLRVDPVETAQAALDERYPNHPVKQGADTLLHVEIDHADVPDLVNLLVAREVAIYEVIRDKRTLEDFFLSVTSSGTTVTGSGSPQPEQRELEMNRVN